jgi:hypothetical protein
MISQQQAQQKLQSGISGGSQAYQMGVGAITEHPGVKAAQNEVGYLAGVQHNVGKWRRNVQRMPLEELKQRMKTKGASNFTASAKQAADSWGQAMQTWYPIIASASQQVRAMPNASRGDRKSRMNQYFDIMSNAADQQLAST